jgi:hypothetical protein
MTALAPAQVDRACGALLASAAGDALDAGYEFTYPAADLVPEMTGGGLGGFAPGEWTDDTAQAVAIARIAATGVDLRTPEALSDIAQGFADWYAGGPADVGVQTAAVLSLAGPSPSGSTMTAAAREVHERSGRSAGNGSLMRTGPVALAHLDALGTAIRIGHDTDTVASIAGALLGARWGMSAVPAAWRRVLHGWPDARGVDLERLACLIVRGGRPGKYGWPLVDHIDYAELQYGLPALVPHPYDPGVLLAGATVLDEVPVEVDAVVSLCLTGREQVHRRLEHVTFRLVDEPAPEQSPNLDYVLADAAALVRDLRDEGKTVLLHCVAAHSRTPAVAIAYALLRGVPLDEALPAARPNSGFRDALARLA